MVAQIAETQEHLLSSRRGLLMVGLETLSRLPAVAVGLDAIGP